MHHFEYHNGRLHAEDVPVEDLARQFGTPLYVYSKATFSRHFQAFDSAFSSLPHITCYSVKANSNLCVLRLLASLGAGMDIVSGGELHRALKAGVSPEKIVYSGVGKRPEEIRQALDAGILMFNVESREELRTISAIASESGRIARISLRINPDVDPKTHPYISTGMKKNKFGLDMETSLETYRMAKGLPGIEPVGIDCHIGSQLTSIEPFLEALDKLVEFYGKLREMGIDIRYLDLGGGLGITYNEEEPPHPEAFGKALTERLKGLPLTIILEPGRVIAGNAGILVTKVLYTKSTPSKDFVIVDAAMNDLVRPSLYGSFHRIAEVVEHNRPKINVDVVGPICESGDFLARDRELPNVESGELLAAFSAGAYGFAMSSQYNSRPRAAEVMVDGEVTVLARRRETYDDLVAAEMGCLERVVD
ncbi:diaminopimelate decarboxylase [Desulfocurvibacter africanus PCS]|uniref:Diaminopimelate decarboxylase n=1 Tax=Desulfocurvibacter africanus PCS TaxID=1262666 RepID=M5PWX8_DESAF|nr:diaminopimelate decarboxylase [Desulfocurvibacter africanus]EMG38827.1 diaminopimelate decarboxylase [Desulfocurvibacter africanus PCS]